MEEDSIEDRRWCLEGLLRTSRKERKRRKGRRRGRSVPTETKRKGRKMMPVGSKGKKTMRANKFTVTPLNSLILSPPKRTYRKTTGLVSQPLVWITQEQNLNQVVSPPFPQASQDTIIRSTWTMKMMIS
jgi:hypothetical protein